MRYNSYDDRVLAVDTSWQTYEGNQEGMNPTDEKLLEVIDKVYNTEKYSVKPIGDFIYAYLSVVGKNVAGVWLIRNGFIKDAMNIIGNQQRFYSKVVSNFGYFDKKRFEELESMSSQENQIYILCMLHEDKYKFKKQLYKKADYLKKFEDMCDGDQRVLDMKILNKSPLSGRSLKTHVSSIFIELCKTEKMFDKWVSKKTTIGESKYHTFNIKDETQLGYFGKWVNVNTNMNIRVPALMKTQENLVSILDVLLGSRHKRSGSTSESIEKILRLMGVGTNVGTFDKELFEKKVIETSLVKKTLANQIARSFPEACHNYLAFKKL